MLRLTNHFKRNIVNSKIVHNKTQLQNDSKLPFYSLVGFKEIKLGAMSFNKPDNNNNITEECADELFRFMNSFHHDHTVQNVWIQNKGKSFSGGADYDQLKNSDIYLDKLHRLSIMISRFNKPVFAKIDGSVRGISSYLLTMLSTPIGTDSSSLRLDETSRGFIPIFGGTQRLASMPCNVGLYLALTGQKLDSDSMARLGFLKARVSEEFYNNSFRKKLGQANMYMSVPFSANSYSLSELRREGIIIEKMKKFDFFLNKSQQEIFQSKRNFYGKFAYNQYNIAKVQYENILNPFNSLSPKNIVLNNYFQIRHDRPFAYLSKKQMIQEARTQDYFLASAPVHKLASIFGQSSLQKIFEHLEADQSEWGKKTLQQLRKKDPLALHITFRLIKQAKQKSWIQCLERQYTVAKRLIERSEVQIREHEGGSLKIFTNQFSNKKAEQISEKDLQVFMKKQTETNQIFEHDSPKYALFPTSDYWRKYPDSGRNYLNRTIFDDVHLKNHQQQVRRFLNIHNIDYRDRSYNLYDLQKSFYQTEMYENLIQAQKTRLRGILKGGYEFKKIQHQRQMRLERQLQNLDTMANKIKNRVEKYFDKKFDNRYEEMMQTAELAGKQSKMDIFRSYVDTMTENIVMKGRQYQLKGQFTNLRHEGIVRFDEDGKNVFEAETSRQKNSQFIQELKKVVKNAGTLKDMPSQLLDQEKPQNQNFLFEYHKTRCEKKRDLDHYYLMKNYGNDTIAKRTKTFAYRALIERAAQTSQEIGQLLEWQNSDITTMMQNSPKAPQMLGHFAQNVLYESNNQIEDCIQKINVSYKTVKELKLMEKIAMNEKKEIQKDSEFQIFFDPTIIPKPFREIYLKLFKVVFNFFAEKYDNEGQILPKKDKNTIKNWAYHGFKTDLTQFLKNDVLYVFSYLSVIHLKQIMEYNDERDEQGRRNAEFNTLFEVEFERFTPEQIDQECKKFFYILVDMHGEAKHHLIMPQTKLIDFINRQRAHFDVDDENLSFQTLVYLISKDRKRLHDHTKGNVPLLGYEPEQMLNLIHTQKKNLASPYPKLQQKVLKKQTVDQDGEQIEQDPLKEYEDEAEDLNNRPEIIIRAQVKRQLTNFNSLKKKSLVTSFNGYLSRFEVELQKIAGSDLFLPEERRDQINRKAYEQLCQILNLTLSPEEWFQKKLNSVIQMLLEYRLQKEKTITKGELIQFDEDYSLLFIPEIIAMLIHFQSQKQQKIARFIISGQFDQIPQQQEQSTPYYHMMKNIKNPRALKMLNNLIMTRNVIKDRYLDIEAENSKEVMTNQQSTQLKKQINVEVPVHTVKRLLQEAMRYKDDEVSLKESDQIYRKNMKHNSQQLEPLSNFVDEVCNIAQIMDQDILKTKLKSTIQKLQLI